VYFWKIKTQIREIKVLPALNLLVCPSQVITELLTLYPCTSPDSCLTTLNFIEMAADIVVSAPCCEILPSMQKLNSLITGPKEGIFLTQTVLRCWLKWFSPKYGIKFNSYQCELKGLLKFYLECSGSFKDWITIGDDTSWHLLLGTLAEILICLEETETWKCHVHDFMELVRKTIDYYNIHICNFKFFYQTKEEWLKIVQTVIVSFFVTTKETSRPIQVPSSIAVPLIQSLISEFGKNGAKAMLGDN